MEGQGLLESTKKILRSLVIARPTEMTIQQLSRDYIESEGTIIPYSKLGYSNVETFLKSISDTLLVVGTGQIAKIVPIVNNESKHIVNMIKKQKKNNNHNKYNRGQYQTPQRNYYNTGQQNSYQQPNQYLLAPQIPQQYFLQMPHYSNPLLQQQVQGYYNNNVVFHPYLNQSFRFNNHPLTNTSPVPYPYYGNPLFAQKTTIQQQQNWLPKLPIRQEQTQQVFNNLDNNEEKKFSPSGKNMEFSVSNMTEHSNVSAELNEENNRNETNSDTRTAELIDFHSEIYNNSSVIELNEEMSKINLINDENVNTLDELIDMEEFLKKVIIKDPYNENIGNTDEALPDLLEDDQFFYMDLPPNIVKYSENIKPFVIPDYIKAGMDVPIFVSEVHSPFKFWFHLRNESGPLNDLMNSIEEFYRDDKEAYKIPSNMMKVNQICAAKFQGYWHRAKIIAVHGNEAKVFFIDYGTVSVVANPDIRFLLKEYLPLPCQAIRGCLAHIKPLMHKWERAAAVTMLSLTRDKLIYARISEIDRNDQIIYVVLVDTTENPHIVINLELIEGGFGRTNFLYSDSSQQQIDNTSQHIREKHCAELYPTFEMLENGIYPTFEELGNMLIKNYNVEQLDDENCLPHETSYHLLGVDENIRQASSPNNCFDMAPTNPFYEGVMELNSNHGSAGVKERNHFHKAVSIGRKIENITKNFNNIDLMESD